MRSVVYGFLLYLISVAVPYTSIAAERESLPKTIDGQQVAMVGAEGYQIVAADGYQLDGPMLAVDAGYPSTQPVAGAEQVTCTDVIVAVYLRRNLQLSDGTVAYLCGDDLFVPWQSLMLLLEFPIAVTTEGAKGWFLQEDRTFDLNLITRTVKIKDTQYPVAADATRYFEGELFVAARSLAKWLPLEFLVDLRALSLYINPKEKLPMEQRLERAQQRFGSLEFNQSRLPHVNTPYALAQVPALHADLYAGYSERKSQSDNNFVANGTVRAFGDPGYMNSHSWFSANETRVNNAYMRLGRSDPQGDLLGPMAATSWEVGDVVSSSVPLVATTLSGRGAHISSRASSFVAQFDRVNLEDTLPPGYEVELYRNDVLMNAQRSSADGRYRFEDVPLMRGRNELRLEFYGPQGQRHTETKLYYINDNQVPTGSFNYDLSVTEVGRSVFGVNDYMNNYYSDGALGASAQLDYGLTPGLSLTGGLLAMPLRINSLQINNTSQKHRYYANLGARTNLLGIGLALDSAFDDVGGKALGVNARRQLANWEVNLGYSRYLDNFVTAASASSAMGSIGNYGASDAIQSQTLANIRRNFYDAATRLSFNLGFDSSYADYVSGQHIWSLGNNMGLSYGRFGFNSNTYYQQSQFTHNTYTNSSISLRLAEAMSLRASAGYNFTDQAFNSYSLGFDAAIADKLNLNVNYYRTPANPNSGTSYSSDGYYVSLTRELEAANVGLQLSQTDSSGANTAVKDGWIIAATVSFDLFADPSSGSVQLSSKSIVSQGAIRTLAFADANANGIRDSGEELLGGIGVISSAYGGNTPYTTSTTAAVSPKYSIPTGNWMDVRLDPNNMPDPSLAPGVPGVAVLPRAGVVSEIELPVVVAADIEGIVTLKSVTGDLRPLPNVRVQVVRQEPSGSETVMAEAHTEYDGFYTLTGVPVGTYTLRIFPDQVKLLSAQSVTRKITLTRQTGLLEHIDIELNQKMLPKKQKPKNKMVSR